MGGYADQLRMRGPSLVEIAEKAGLTYAQRQAREAQRQQQEREDARYDAEQSRLRSLDELNLRKQESVENAQRLDRVQAQKEAAQKSTANLERYYARLAEQNQDNPEALGRIFAGARARGIDLGAAQPMQVQIAGGPAQEANWNPPGPMSPQRPEQLQAAPRGAEMAAQEAAARAPKIAMDLEGRAAGVLGVQKPEDERRAPSTPDIIEYERAQQDPGFAAHLSTQRATKAGKGDSATDLRKEFQSLPTVKNMGAVAEAYEKIKGAGATGAGDMSLVFGYMKLLDPNSSVREGEYANAENAGGISDKIRGWYNKAVSGEFLTPELRQNFRAEGGRVYAAQVRRYEADAENYSRLAEKAGFDPADIVLDRGYGGGQQAAQPEAEAVNAQAQAQAFYEQLKAAGVDPAQARQMTVSKFRKGAQ